MAAQRIAAQKNCVEQQNQSSDADSKTIFKPHSLPRVVRKEHDENECQIQEVAMYVVNDQRKGPLAQILLTRLTHGTRWRICPKCFVISAAIVITGDTESAGRPKDQHRARDP